jgi:hypothetical protein
LSAQTNIRSLYSPGKNLKVVVGLNPKTGTPFYTLWFGGRPVSKGDLGLKSKEADFSQGFSWVQTRTSSTDQRWKPLWGEVASIRDRHNELVMCLENASGKLNIRFRAFDDGLGFRYEFPEQALRQLDITEEMTEFGMSGDHMAWWLPGDYGSNEHTYSTTRISKIDASWYLKDQENFTQTIPDVHAVETPITMRSAQGTHLSIAEAAVADFPAMQLKVDRRALRFKANLVPTADTTLRSRNTLPFQTPWRVVLTAKNAAGLLDSKLILNLNEPCKIEGDLIWIKPQKYVGIWWEMHVGKSTWDYAGQQDVNASLGLKPSGKHGATTENTKKYMDFAAKHGFDGVLVEGWNHGWENWFNTMREEVFDFKKPYPDFDVAELSRYGAERGVKLILHHETGSAVASYERQMDEAYAFMRQHGVNTVKTGYVGFVLPKGEWHYGQRMVNHYLRVAERTARNKIMLNTHEPIRPSGQHRTWPNWLATEAARGMEFNAWSKGNPPEHETILPFTRLLGGPMDYTPGIFQIHVNQFDPNKKEQVHSTVAKQLALYVTLYSPLQMAADLPENYEKRLDVFEFIKNVPVDWDDTRVLSAAIGDHLAIARRQKGGENWYLGAITDENARSLSLKLDFLKPGKTYEAILYEDGPGAHYKSNPYPVGIRKIRVRKGQALALQLAAGGGCAIEIRGK